MEKDILDAIKSAWGWIGIRPQKLYWVNKFGNLIIKDQAGCCWLIRPEELLCEIIARTEEEMGQLWKSEDFIIDWEMTALVELAEGKFGKNDNYRCYYFVIPPVLGGKYDLQNIQTLSLLELISLSGDTAEQVKDIPNGTQVDLVIKRKN